MSVLRQRFRMSRSGMGIRLGVLSNAAFYAVIAVSVPIGLASKGFDKAAIATFFIIGSLTAGALNLWAGPVLRRRTRPWWRVSGAATIGLLGILWIHLSTGTVYTWIASPAVAAMTLVFPSLVSVNVEHDQRHTGARQIGSLRGMFISGYLLGLGSLSIVQTVAARGVPIDPLLLASGFAALNAASGLLVRSARPEEAVPDRPGSGAQPYRWTLAVAAVAVLALVAADTLRLVYLPLYVVSRGISPAWVPVLVIASVLAELPSLAVLGRMSDRFGSQAVLVSICAIGVVAFSMLVIGGDIGFLLITQLIYAPFAAGVQSIAVVYLGEVVEGGLGFGAGLFAALLQVGALVGVAAPLLVSGYSGEIFVLSAGFSLFAGMLVMFVNRARRSGSESPLQRSTSCK